MRSPTFVHLLIASCAALAITPVSGSVLHAQARAGGGLITAVDLITNTLVLETRTGSETIRVAPTATIHGDHDEVLTIRDLAPGDAVSYQSASDTVANLRVARQFWAIPCERCRSGRVVGPTDGTTTDCPSAAEAPPAHGRTDRPDRSAGCRPRAG
jgi:hypothetical protein